MHPGNWNAVGGSLGAQLLRKWHATYTGRLKIRWLDLPTRHDEPGPAS